MTANFEPAEEPESDAELVCTCGQRCSLHVLDHSREFGQRISLLLKNPIENNVITNSPSNSQRLPPDMRKNILITVFDTGGHIFSELFKILATFCETKIWRYVVSATTLALSYRIIEIVRDMSFRINGF